MARQVPIMLSPSSISEDTKIVVEAQEVSHDKHMSDFWPRFEVLLIAGGSKVSMRVYTVPKADN